MKPQRSGEKHLEEESRVHAVSSADLPVVSAPSLSTEEEAVIECLRVAAAGLTARQLQSRISCDPDVLERALKSLIDRELVARLNTIIPSYVYRPQSLPSHEG